MKTDSKYLLTPLLVHREIAFQLGVDPKQIEFAPEIYRGGLRVFVKYKEHSAEKVFRSVDLLLSLDNFSDRFIKPMVKSWK